MVTMEAEKLNHRVLLMLLPHLRLKTTQNLGVVRANAADSDVQAMEVSDQQNFSEVREKADSPADHDTADQKCYTSASTEFMVTGP